MKPDLQNLMEIYVNKIRPQWAATSFSLLRGKTSLREQLEEGFNLLWKKPNFELAKQLAHVSVRKFMTTKDQGKRVTGGGCHCSEGRGPFLKDC